MALNKLVAGTSASDPLASTGADVAAVVNGLVDAVGIQYNPLNIYTLPYWLPAPAYAASTAYTAGQAVTNAGNTYVCLTGGTTGASSAPTATTNNPITDGTVSWLYFGTAPTALAGAPTVTVVGSTPAGQTKLVLTDVAESWYNIKGGVYTFGTNGPEWNLNVEPKNALGYFVEFMTDSVDFTLRFRYGTVPIRFTVDGRFVSPSVLSASGDNRFRFQFTGERKVRKIGFFWSGSNSFYGIQLNPVDSVWKPAAEGAVNLFVVGDSYIGGSNFHPATTERGIHHIVANAIGCKNYQADGVGGSGYISAGSETPFGSATRLARVNLNSNVIVVLGGINDTLTGLQAAVVSYLSSLRARCPRALIVVGGVYAGVSGPDATTLNKEQAIKDAVTQANDSRIVFMPISSAISPWISGTGRVSATNNSGNSDLYQSPDGTHPIAQATEYYAGRILAFLSNSI